MKKTKIISAFPACGKTYVSKKLAGALKHVVYLDKDTLVSSVGVMIMIQPIQIKLKSIVILNFQKIILSTLKRILEKLIISL